MSKFIKEGGLFFFILALAIVQAVGLFLPAVIAPEVVVAINGAVLAGGAYALCTLVTQRDKARGALAEVECDLRIAEGWDKTATGQIAAKSAEIIRLRQREKDLTDELSGLVADNEAKSKKINWLDQDLDRLLKERKDLTRAFVDLGIEEITVVSPRHQVAHSIGFHVVDWNLVVEELTGLRRVITDSDHMKAQMAQRALSEQLYREHCGEATDEQT